MKDFSVNDIVPLDKHEVLAAIANQPCERASRNEPGDCFRQGYLPLARYSNDRVCNPCFAWAARQ